MESPSYARQAYTLEIRQLEHDLLEMGSIAETMIGQSVESLSQLDTGLALRVIQRDDEIDERNLAIENRCIRLFGLQHPQGADLRVVSTAMKMITDIERVGDLAVDIAKIALKIDKEMGSAGAIDLPKMGAVARSMFREALEAFVRRDLGLVASVATQETVVDGMYRDLRDQIFASMRKDPEQAVADGWLFMAIHHIERIADHALNIAERVQYMVTGQQCKLSSFREQAEVQADPEP